MTTAHGDVGLEREGVGGYLRIALAEWMLNAIVESTYNNVHTYTLKYKLSSKYVLR